MLQNLEQLLWYIVIIASLYSKHYTMLIIDRNYLYYNYVIYVYKIS